MLLAQEAWLLLTLEAWLLLAQEAWVLMAQEAWVPKLLDGTSEAVLGALSLESGRFLSTVWELFLAAGQGCSLNMVFDRIRQPLGGSKHHLLGMLRSFGSFGCSFWSSGTDSPWRRRSLTMANRRSLVVVSAGSPFR